MRYLKKYEHINEPKIGDYVIVNPRIYNKILKSFFENHIGQIIDESRMYEDSWIVEFDKKNPWDFSKTSPILKSEIEYYSKNKKDLEIYIDKNKYNL